MFQTYSSVADPSVAAPRIADMQKQMERRRIDAYIVPRTDEHQGEYIPENAERLHWLTGFSGSAGSCVVTNDTAALFVDGRYTVQARFETDPKTITVVPMAEKPAEVWIFENLPDSSVIGFDPKLFTLAQIERLKTRLAPKSIKLKAIRPNLVDKLWGQERPEPPSGAITLHKIDNAGEAVEAKLETIRSALKETGADAVVLSARESIAWAFNLRGSDVAHTPVFSSFAIIHQRAKPELFLDTSKLTSKARDATRQIAKVTAYDKFWDRLKALKEAGKTVQIDPNVASFEIARLLGGARKIKRAADPCVAPRAIKNSTEIAGARLVHERDGAAVAKFLAWLESAAARGDLDEITAAQKLEEFRAETGELKEISFDTIAGSGPNGAIVHYRVNTKTNRVLKPGELFLVDSGAQYAEGTTDITRTVAIGNPSAEMRERFTLVLKGHISVATTKFPKGTRGRDLDPFARRALWQAGLDYDHGTGHGVGSYLSVHEGPISISRVANALVQPGMIISNEPGYYKEGGYGIRIENLILVNELEKPKGGERPMMSFETLTLAPIDRQLIDKALLTDEERAWLNDYHARVLAKIGPAVDKATKAWLKEACAPL